MPRLLFAYLATQILAPFFASLVILSSVLFLTNLVPLLDIIVDFGISFADFVRLYAYLTPQLLLFSMPMASMMGMVLGFTRLTNDGEIMILKSCGTSLYKMLPPVIVIAFCSAWLTGLFSIQLIPAGTQAMEQLLYHLAKEKIDKGLREKRFSEGLGDIVIYADRVAPGSNQWQGVYVSDLRDPNTPVTIMARTGSLASRMQSRILTLALHDGSLHRAAGDTIQTIRFKNYALDFHIPVPDNSPGNVKKSVSGLTQKKLLAQAASFGFDSKQGADLLREYHKRLVLPVSCFILSLLGCPLGLLVSPGRRAIGIPIGLGFFTLYYIMLTAAEAASEALVLPVAVAMWLPNLLFFALTIYLIRATARENIAIHIERLLAALAGWAGRLPLPPGLKRRKP